MSLNLYYISNEYLEYLRKFDKRIYENKEYEKNKKFKIHLQISKKSDNIIAM